MELTPDGVRMLRGELPRDEDAGVLLQVLAIHRYLVDPALKQLLRDAGHDHKIERDAFDVVLSDGQRKFKCLLSPALNDIVWRGQLALLDIMWVSEFTLLVVNDGRTVCLIVDCEPITNESHSFLIVAPQLLPLQPSQRGRLPPQQLVSKDTGDDLVFADGVVGARDTALLPLVGERAYYLPLDSESYTLQWADDLQCSSNAPKYCTSVFAPGTTTLQSIREVHATIRNAMKRGRKTTAALSFPPVTGIVQVKSHVVHFGDPEVTNPLPFVFHIVLAIDRVSAVEVAFFGAMCAQYAARIREGDVIQLRGYDVYNSDSVDSSDSDDDSDSAGQLLYFAHDSTGEALHVPERFWKLLETTQILNPRVNNAAAGVAPSRQWLHCDFANTHDITQWTDGSDDTTRFFDFVGVLSYVGRICRSRRKRKRTIDGDDCGTSTSNIVSSAVQTYRWVQAIDASSTTALTILVRDCALATQRLFAQLAAGDVMLLTKLSFVAVDNVAARAVAADVADLSALADRAFAVTSNYSTLHVNDAVATFSSDSADCDAAMAFAKQCADVDTRHVAGESWLEDGRQARHGSGRPASNGKAKSKSATTLARQACKFSELAGLCERLESLEHRHVGVIGRLLSLSLPLANDEASTASTAAHKIEFGDSRGVERSRRAALRISALVDPATRQRRLRGVAPRDLRLLVEILEPALVDELIAEAPVSNRTQRDLSTATASTSDSESDGIDDATEAPVLSRAFLEQRLVKSRRVFYFSTHLYRTPGGRVDVHVDAIQSYNLEV